MSGNTAGDNLFHGFDVRGRKCLEMRIVVVCQPSKWWGRSCCRAERWLKAAVGISPNNSSCIKPRGFELLYLMVHFVLIKKIKNDKKRASLNYMLPD